MEGTGSPIAALFQSLPLQEEAAGEEGGGAGESPAPLASPEDETTSSSFSSSSDVDQPLRTEPPVPPEPPPDRADSPCRTQPPAPPPCPSAGPRDPPRPQEAPTGPRDPPRPQEAPAGPRDPPRPQEPPAGSSAAERRPEEGDPVRLPPPLPSDTGGQAPGPPSLEDQEPRRHHPPPAPPTLAPPVAAEALSGGLEGGEPCAPARPAPGTKLCGYLAKRGGPLRAWKRRWFMYEEKKSQLFYYRTAQDLTPLGRVGLGSATFTLPLKGEEGCFHIQTPERTYILKAVNQAAMMYWLQQLQMRRWQYREFLSGGALSQPASSDTTNNNNNVSAGSPEDFLPMVKSPQGLVGEEAANQPPQPRTGGLANMSLKHPFIEIQNSVHNLLAKRSSQEYSQSVFHVESAPPWTPPSQLAGTSPTTLQTPPIFPTPGTPTTPTTPSTPSSPITPLLPSTGPSGQRPPEGDRKPPAGLNTQNSRRSKSRGTVSNIRRETSSADRMSRLQQDKDMLGEEVKSQKELVWLLHKALEASQLEKRTCTEFLAAEGEQQRLEVLRHRERQAADLRRRLDDLTAQTEGLRRSLAEKESQVVDLQENIDLLTEKNQAKQEVILKISDQLSTCMANPQRKVSTSIGLQAQTCSLLQEENENLKDDIAAYKTQNKFLNSEIYQLTKLWRKSSEQEKSLMVKCAYLEASGCQKESRYLGVLQRLQETQGLDAAQKGVVRGLVEDALQGDPAGSLQKAALGGPPLDHDDYGFKILPDYEVEDIKLLAKIQALEIRSHNLLYQDAGDRPLLGRWSQFLASRSDGDFGQSPELKNLLRAGVPREFRQRVWRWIVRARTLTLREQHPHRYQQLCEKSLTSPHPASRQILLDLHRTLTTNKHFSAPSSPALQKLQRILLAFSWQNPTIGYCQGLNRLAAVSLLVLQDEEDAFWCLVAVVEVIMPLDYYTKNLVASQADQRVLKDFMAEKLPRLAAHLEEHAVDVSLVTFNWFLVCFVESLPSDLLLRVWDAFLYEGTKVLFRYALALFKYKEEDILKIHDNVEIYQYLRFFTKTVTDGRKLTSIAFTMMNPFPGRILRNRRAAHLERLQGEMRELEEQQKEFISECPVQKDKDLDTLLSEDEEEP
ncbi:TBC1 domain family member 2A [Gadus morhua]|uniref:TBC1 domain family, member 2 n=1 Tax=Gadus morhua TaxID=8049 RepID=A0A8C4ZGR1_GADMO|nr:TBC1 domain family member 2A [Gadus morhua]